MVNYYASAAQIVTDARTQAAQASIPATTFTTSNSAIPYGWLGWDGVCRLHRTVGADGQRQHALDCPWVAAQYPAWRRAAVRAAGTRARMVTAAKSSVKSRRKAVRV